MLNELLQRLQCFSAGDAPSHARGANHEGFTEIILTAEENPPDDEHHRQHERQGVFCDVTHEGRRMDSVLVRNGLTMKLAPLRM